MNLNHLIYYTKYKINLSVQNYMHILANKMPLKQLLLFSKEKETLYHCIFIFYINVSYFCSNSDSESDSELE